MNKIIVYSYITNNVNNKKWPSITYKDDKDYVVSSLENMMKNGEYPEGIWQ